MDGERQTAQQHAIAEVFEITGRGAVVVVEKTTDHTPGKPYHVEIRGPNGEVFTTEAYMEFVLRRNPIPHEKEAYWLKGLHKGDIPNRSVLVFL